MKSYPLEFSDLVENYFQNRRIIHDLKQRDRDPGEQTLLELFQELQIDMGKTIERYCHRFGFENPTHDN
jgi:hypothetical protein